MVNIYMYLVKNSAFLKSFPQETPLKLCHEVTTIILSLKLRIPIKKQVTGNLRTYYMLCFKNRTSRKHNNKDEKLRVLTSNPEMKQPV